jgi:predicted metal-dependent HD superfamily phosphohydrolase
VDEIEELRGRWAALGGAPETGDDLLRRYAEPHRRYHGVAHLRAVLDAVDDLAGHAADADAVRLAAWFHDAVYDPARDDNERASADLARARLGGHPAAGEVVRLVLLTAQHAPLPADRDGAVLCDADLAILAADPETYAAYAAAVRAEYAAVPDDAFRAGRARVLGDLLGHRWLFHTPAGRDRYESAARRNLRTELDLLGGSRGA